MHFKLENKAPPKKIKNPTQQEEEQNPIKNPTNTKAVDSKNRFFFKLNCQCEDYGAFYFTYYFILVWSLWLKTFVG